MRCLITDLLVLSRVTRKGQPFRLIPLETVIQEVLSDLEENIKDVDGRVEIGPCMTIEADVTQMHQIFQNLIGNALKFHRPGIPPVVKVSVLPENERTCRIIVEDNGIGFEEKYVDKIFAVFERLHGESEYEGTGIGLAIVRKIVERHQGSITVKSQPGIGTTFVVTLPVHHAEA
jgi:signal transduction histidine kinase